MGPADVLLVELKVAAIDVAARTATERGMRVEFCDNRVVAIGDEPFEALLGDLAELAVQRHRSHP
jgi:hypothetical protein